MRPPYLSIIVPLHNEERRLALCVRELKSWIWRTSWAVEILLVLNGCDDDTLGVAQNAAHEYQNIRILQLAERGKGIAVRRGMLEAVANYRYMCDVDLATKPDHIPAFVHAARDGSDLVIGQRDRSGDPALRRLSSEMFGALVRTLVSEPDTQCGFKLFTAHAAEEIFALAQVDGMAFDVEVLYLAHRLGLRVTSLRVPWQHDADSRVRIVRDSLRMAQDVARIRRLHHAVNPVRAVA